MHRMPLLSRVSCWRSWRLSSWLAARELQTEPWMLVLRGAEICFEFFCSVLTLPLFPYWERFRHPILSIKHDSGSHSILLKKVECSCCINVRMLGFKVKTTASQQQPTRLPIITCFRNNNIASAPAVGIFGSQLSNMSTQLRIIEHYHFTEACACTSIIPVNHCTCKCNHRQHEIFDG